MQGGLRPTQSCQKTERNPAWDVEFLTYGRLDWKAGLGWEIEPGFIFGLGLCFEWLANDGRLMETPRCQKKIQNMYDSTLFTPNKLKNST